MTATCRVVPPSRTAVRSRPGRSSQRGVALLVVALLSALVGLIAMSQMGSVGGLFRAARDERDLLLARQAAEAALRDAEADVACMRWSNGVWEQVLASQTVNTHCVSVAPHCSQMMPTGDAPAIRLLGRNPSTAPAAVDWEKSLADCTAGGCAVELGAKTGAPTFDGVARQPRYQVDAFDVSAAGTAEPVPLFRITARGYGATAGTVSELQEVYRLCR
jgi:type IV pilus assembly protein PilX